MACYERMAVLAALFAAFGLAGCPSESCKDGNRTFAEGSHWTCSDGCNSCSCDDGETTSTLMACAGPPGESAGKLRCLNGSEWVAHGTTWNCDDRCCECVDGNVATKPGAC
jgi:hypothetical protein